MLSPASSISKYKYTYAYTHAHNNTQQLQLRASTYAQKANVFGVLAREQVKIIAIDAARGVLVYDSKILEAWRVHPCQNRKVLKMGKVSNIRHVLQWLHTWKSGIWQNKPKKGEREAETREKE